MRLYHLTDTHLGEAGGRGEEAIQAAVEAMRWCDLLLLTGDITHGGTAEQYDLAARLLFPLRGRVILCPGNHDYSDGVHPFGLTYSDEGKRRYHDLCALLASPTPGTMLVPAGTDVVIVALDSCRWSVSPLDLARGHLGPKQFQRLRDVLGVARTSNLRPVVLLHHDTVDRDPTMTLEDGDQFLAEAYGQAWAILSGHTHGQACEWTSTQGKPTLLRRGQDAVGGGAGSLWSIEV